eukprot:403373702
MAANSKVRLGTSIASGAFGTVYSALLTREIKEYIAMKVIKRENRGQIQELDQYNLIEIEIMSQIDNPYINKLIDYYFQVDQKTKQEELVLLSPLAMYDLNKFLENNYPKGRMPESMAIEFLAQLAFGTKAMHDKKVIHRDLNPRNILVFKNEQKSALNNQEFILKISDFGCSKILGIDQSRALTQQVGKINYMAPEQLNNSVQGYNASVDVYGLGLTIFQMISGKVFNAADITSRNFKDQYSSSFIDLLYKLCSLDYKQRPSVDQLIEHPIVQKSQTFINCLLQGILPMTTSKIISTIGCLQNLQKVREQPKDQDFEWQKSYEMAFGNNDKQYFINKYLGESNLQNDEKLRILNGCSFKREVDANGDIFIGFYKDDSKFYGRSYERDRIKEGHLSNGKFHGVTSEYVRNFFGDNYYYDGDYVDGIPNGYGVMIFSNGEMYCCEYKNGKKHGLGTCYWNDGNSYEGQWMDWNRHGEGVYKYANGDIEKGTWKDNKQHGEFIKTYASGKQEKIIYKMGKQIPREVIQIPRQEDKQSVCNQQ